MHIVHFIDIPILKDIPLLDCVGPQHPCRHRSYDLSIRILRSVYLPIYLHSLVDFRLLSLATWIASVAPLTILQFQISTQPTSSHRLLLFSLVTSMAVNTLVTGLIVFKISMVFREAKTRISSAGLGGTSDGSRLRSIIFILIESGMALFCIQVARMTVTIYVDEEVYDLVVGIHQMLNVIIRSISVTPCLANNVDWQGLTPTIILVRVSMGLSFHDKKTMVDATTTHWHFRPPSSELETENSSIIISHPRGSY